MRLTEARPHGAQTRGMVHRPEIKKSMYKGRRSIDRDRTETRKYKKRGERVYNIIIIDFKLVTGVNIF